MWQKCNVFHVMNINHLYVPHLIQCRFFTPWNTFWCVTHRRNNKNHSAEILLLNMVVAIFNFVSIMKSSVQMQVTLQLFHCFLLYTFLFSYSTEWATVWWKNIPEINRYFEVYVVNLFFSNIVYNFNNLVLGGSSFITILDSL